MNDLCWFVIINHVCLYTIKYNNNMYLEVSGKAISKISKKQKTKTKKLQISPVLWSFPSAGKKFQDM